MINDVTNGFKAYKTYLALKCHFNSNYDYFKYKGKVKADINSFLKRKDKFFFHKLEKKYRGDELVYFFVSNFIERKNEDWIGEFTNDASEKTYIEWKKFIESLGYNYRNQLYNIDYSIGLQTDSPFIVKDNNHPPLLKMYLRKEIRLETIIILDSILNFIDYWNKHLTDYVWEENKTLMRNYKPFLTYDIVKYKNITKEVFNDRLK